MKPPIEYRPKSKGVKPISPLNPAQQAFRSRFRRFAPEQPADTAQPQAKAVEPTSGADFIVIRRNRAKYNAYMRAYRAKKKAAK